MKEVRSESLVKEGWCYRVGEGGLLRDFDKGRLVRNGW